jgi:hypothetical protein
MTTTDGTDDLQLSLPNLYLCARACTYLGGRYGHPLINEARICETGAL